MCSLRVLDQFICSGIRGRRAQQNDQPVLRQRAGRHGDLVLAVGHEQAARQLLRRPDDGGGDVARAGVNRRLLRENLCDFWPSLSDRFHLHRVLEPWDPGTGGTAVEHDGCPRSVHHFIAEKHQPDPAEVKRSSGQTGLKIGFDLVLPRHAAGAIDNHCLRRRARGQEHRRGSDR